MQDSENLSAIIERINSIPIDWADDSPERVRDSVHELCEEYPDHAEPALVDALIANRIEVSEGGMLAVDYLAERQGRLEPKTIDAIAPFVSGDSYSRIREYACGALANVCPYNVDPDLRHYIYRLLSRIIGPLRENASSRELDLAQRSLRQMEGYDEICQKVADGRIIMPDEIIDELLSPLAAAGKSFRKMGYDRAAPQRFREAIAATLLGVEIGISNNAPPAVYGARKFLAQISGPNGARAGVHSFWYATRSQNEMKLLTVQYLSRIRRSPLEEIGVE